MAIITEMLGEKVISGFKGTLDFYYWMGIPCVRRWPMSPGHRRSPAVQAGWTPFTSAVHLWNSTPYILRDSFQSMSSGTGLTARDLFMRAYMAGIPRMYDLPVGTLPPPPSSYWAIIDFEKILLDDGFLIITETDTPCHLWLCWTDVEPQKHLDPVLRRGLAMHCDPRFCFVAYNCIEQDQAGDTLLHTWNIHNWPEGQERWFTFRGTIGGIASPSTSALINLLFGFKIMECVVPTYWQARIDKDRIQYMIFKPPQSHIPEHVHILFRRNGEPGDLTLSVHEMLPSGFPDPSPIESCTREITGMPEWPYGKYFTFQYTIPHLAESIWYALRARCLCEPPTRALWAGWPIKSCPNCYWMEYYIPTSTWYTGATVDLNHLIRGRILG